MRTIPLRAKAIPRVAMNDGTRSLTATRPLIDPSPQHTNSARTMLGNTGTPALFQYVTKKGDTMYIWPTDRSISPRIRTGTSASAKMAKDAMNWDSTRALSNVKKFGDWLVKKIANATATRVLADEPPHTRCGYAAAHLARRQGVRTHILDTPVPNLYRPRM